MDSRGIAFSFHTQSVVRNVVVRKSVVQRNESLKVTRMTVRLAGYGALSETGLCAAQPLS